MSSLSFWCTNIDNEAIPNITVLNTHFHKLSPAPARMSDHQRPTPSSTLVQPYLVLSTLSRSFRQHSPSTPNSSFCLQHTRYNQLQHIKTMDTNLQNKTSRTHYVMPGASHYRMMSEKCQRVPWVWHTFRTLVT